MPAQRPASVLHAADMAQQARISWSPTSDDLAINLVDLKPGQEIAAHVNTSLDVLIVCLAGSGTLRVDGEAHALEPETMIVIPVNASRQFTASDDGVRYVTCHRKVGGIMPQMPSPS